MALAKNVWKKAKWVIVVLVILLCVYLCLGLVHYIGHRGVQEVHELGGMLGAISLYISTHEGAFPGSFQDLVDSDIVKPYGEGRFRGLSLVSEGLYSGWPFRPENMIVAWGYEYREADTMPLVIHKKMRVTGDGATMICTRMLRDYMKQYKKDKKLYPE